MLATFDLAKKILKNPNDLIDTLAEAFSLLKFFLISAIAKGIKKRGIIFFHTEV